MNLNTVTIVGRLAQDPQLKSYKKSDGSDGHRCFFRVAVTRLMDRGQKDATKRRVNWIPVVTWGEAAKRHAQFLAKGTQVSIVGELIAESQKQQDGSFREFFSVQANDIQYGARSMKNATPEQILAQAESLNRRIEALRTGTPTTPAAAPAPAVSDAENPFAG